MRSKARIRDVSYQLIRIALPLVAVFVVYESLGYFQMRQSWSVVWCFALLSIFASLISVRTINSALTINNAVILAGIFLYGTSVGVWSAIIEVLLVAFLYQSKIYKALINAGQMLLTVYIIGTIHQFLLPYPWVVSDLVLIGLYWTLNSTICALAVASIYKAQWTDVFKSMIKGNVETYILILLIALLSERVVQAVGPVSLFPILICYLFLCRLFYRYFRAVHKLENKVVEIKQLNKSIITTMAFSIEARDPYTSGHSWRVAEWGKEIATAMNLSAQEIDEVYLGGILHDIGKIGIEDSILGKPDKLTDQEFEKVKEHPVIGYNILKEARIFPELLPAVRWHHERIDGKGYPDKLKGEEIPLIARILAVSDAFDAMVSDRPYRKGLPVDEALQRIEEGKGTQFDSEIAEIFIEVINKQDLTAILARPNQNFAISFREVAATDLFKNIKDNDQD